MAAFWLVSGLFLGIGALAANPSSDHEAGFVGRIGDERAAAGLAGYAVAPDLVDVARRHAEEMRRQQRLHHNPRLGEDVQGWQSVGENVGVGSSVEAIHEKLMASPSHRDNILSGRFTEVGVGVVVDDGGDLWVVQVFRLPQSSPPPAAPAPEPAPPAESPPGGAEPAPEPEARPAPAPGPADGTADGTVRAATASQPAGGQTGGPDRAAPTTSAPAPPTTGATASTLASTPDVSTSLPEASSPTGETTAAVRDASGNATGVGDARAGSAAALDLGASGRQVTWPVALAAAMLLGVVTALAVHVGGTRVRELAGRRASLLDVWELALAG